MSQRAERVYTDQISIQRLESLIDPLPANGQVVLLMGDGSSCDGVVSARPNVHIFRDANDVEGIHATGKLLRPGVPDWSRHVWLDQVVRVEYLDSTPSSEN